ncbi:MAG TPA: hypothetical protein VF765_19795 [Polyangiaceae bacterium]
MALATLTLPMYRAGAVWTLKSCAVGAALLGVQYLVVPFYGAPCFIPMVLLEVANSVRRQSAAPPLVWRTAVILALPAFAIAVRWPLGIAARFAFDPRSSLALVMTVDHLSACVAIWTASVMATATWMLSAACRWVLWPRPVAVVASGPYR